MKSKSSAISNYTSGYSSLNFQQTVRSQTVLPNCLSDVMKNRSTIYAAKIVTKIPNNIVKNLSKNR